MGNSRKVRIGGSGEADTDIETIASSDDSAEDTTFTTSDTNFEELTKEETLAWVEEQFERLGQQMTEKYPEIARVTELTPDEFNARYSTDAEKDAILELALQAKDEFFADFRELFLMLPSDMGESALAETQTLLAKNWGPEHADTIIADEENGAPLTYKMNPFYVWRNRNPQSA